MKKKKVLMAASVASMIDQFNMPNIRLLLELGYEVHVACNFLEGNTCDRRRIRKLQKTLREWSVPYHQWSCPRDIRSVGAGVQALRQLLELTRQHRFAWIHCHSPIGGALARIVAHRQKIRVIYTAHGFHFYKGAPFTNWLLYYPVEKLLSYWTDILVTVNREDYRFAKRHLRVQTGSIFYIPGIGIDTRRFCRMSADSTQQQKRDFCRKYQIPADAVILLSVGELSRRKNHQAVIAALAELREKNSFYLICGQGEQQKRLLRQAEALGVSDRLRLLGFQEHVEEFYQSADLFVFPSLQEGMPTALMEAMAAGMACVVSDIRGNRELVKDRFSPGKQEQLLKKLERLLADQRLRTQRGLFYQKKIAAYDQKEVQKRMRRIYTQMEPDMRISVLVAVYQPNFKWLHEQLASIFRQTFPVYEVIILDDSTDAAIFHKIQKIAAKSLCGRQRVHLYQNSHREGSNRTFEKMVRFARGNYIAFCDQDDIWEAQKLAKLAQAVQKERAVMAYSDMSVIDENGVQIFPSLSKMRKGLRYVHGSDTTASYVTENCTAGCSMLVRADLAKKALPFVKCTYCDQWVAVCAASWGRVAFVDQPLVHYRRHGRNQTGCLQGICSKQDYDKKRVVPMYRLLREMKKRGIYFKQEKQAAAFAKARMDKNMAGIIRYSKLNWKYACFDLLLLCLPDALADRLFDLLQRK